MGELHLVIVSEIRVSESKNGRTHQVANHGGSVGCGIYEKNVGFWAYDVREKKSETCVRLALCYPLECTAAADARWR